VNDWGYIDRVQRAHRQNAERMAAMPPMPVPPQIQPLQPIVGPLDNLPQAQAEIFYGGGMPDYRNIFEDAMVGAAVGGFFGWALDRLLKRRRQRQAQHVAELEESLGVDPDQ
jgi:hypothetical protein